MNAELERLAVTIEAVLGPLPALLRTALLNVDRARFVRDVDRELAYENLALPLDTAQSTPAPPVAELIQQHGSWLGAVLQPSYIASGSTISQPLMYMLSFKLLELAPGDRYLELGTGTGYGAALAAQVVGPRGCVTSVDVDPALIERARRITAADGSIVFCHDDGLARPDLIAQHDKCWVTFSISELPPAIHDALPEGSRLLAPVGAPPPSQQRYVMYGREQGQVVERDLATPVFFIPRRPLG